MEWGSPVFIRRSPSCLPTEPSPYKRPLGTILGTVEWGEANKSPVVKTYQNLRSEFSASGPRTTQPLVGVSEAVISWRQAAYSCNALSSSSGISRSYTGRHVGRHSPTYQNRSGRQRVPQGGSLRCVDMSAAHGPSHQQKPAGKDPTAGHAHCNPRPRSLQLGDKGGREGDEHKNGEYQAEKHGC